MEDRPVLDQLNLVVGDMYAMVRFYEHLGVEIAPGPPGWTDHHRNTDAASGLHLDLDSSTFAAQWNRGWETDRTGVVIGFRLPTRSGVDSLCGRLEDAGYGVEQPPYDAFFGCRYAVVVDPDGNSVGLMSPRDPELVTTPPAPGS